MSVETALKCSHCICMQKRRGIRLICLKFYLPIFEIKSTLLHKFWIYSSTKLTLNSLSKDYLIHSRRFKLSVVLWRCTLFFPISKCLVCSCPVSLYRIPDSSWSVFLAGIEQFPLCSLSITHMGTSIKSSMQSLFPVKWCTAGLCFRPLFWRCIGMVYSLL